MVVAKVGKCKCESGGHYKHNHLVPCWKHVAVKVITLYHLSNNFRGVNVFYGWKSPTKCSYTIHMINHVRIAIAQNKYWLKSIDENIMVSNDYTTVLIKTVKPAAGVLTLNS